MQTPNHHTHPCPSCGESGYIYQSSCSYCYARKIVALRTGRMPLAGVFQKRILDSLKPNKRDEVMQILKDSFPRV